jgi:hypothetical protein
MRLTNGTKILIVGLLFGASAAYAGRPERDYQKSLEAPTKEAVDAVKAACGCSPAVKVDWDSFKSAENMSVISFAVSSYKTATEETCNHDKDGKAAFCKQVKKVEIKFTGNDPTTVCASGTCTFNINGTSFHGAQYQAFLDKL